MKKTKSQGPKRPAIALIAHDGKKPDMLALCLKNESILERFRLFATKTTGSMVSRKTRLKVKTFLSGPLGGDVQIASLVVDKRIHGVIFLVDPLEKHPHDPDIQTLLRACNVHNIPLASNTATAEILIQSLA